MMNFNNILRMFTISERYLYGNMYVGNDRYEQLKKKLENHDEISLLDQQDIYNTIQDGRFYFNSRVDRVKMDLQYSDISKIKNDCGYEFYNNHNQYTDCYISFLHEDYSNRFVEPENRFLKSGPLPDWAYYEKPLQRDLGSMIKFIFSDQ